MEVSSDRLFRNITADDSLVVLIDDTDCDDTDYRSALSDDIWYDIYVLYDYGTLRYIG